MLATNLKIVAVVTVVLGFYTTVAHIIPQLESDVPEAVDLSGGVTAEALVGAGERLYNGAGGCSACHGLGTRAPNLLTDHEGEGTIGVRCATREPGKDCKAYLYESMTEPAKYVVKGFEVLMPDLRRLFSSEQIWALVAYLEAQGGQVTVTAADIKATGGAAGGLSSAPAAAPPAAAVSPAPAPAAPAPPPPADPRLRALVATGEDIFNGAGACAKCHGTGLLAPSLFTDHAGEGLIGARCGSRVPGKNCKTYLYESLADPKAYVLKGFDPIMPEVRSKLTDEQIWGLVAFLEAQGGEITVTASDIERTSRAASSAAPAPAGPPPSTGAAGGAAPAPAGPPPAAPSGATPAPAGSPPSAAADRPLRTTEEIVAAGEEAYNGRAACGSCHGTGLLAPNLLTDQAGEDLIGARCATRVPGKDCKTYLYESMTEPMAYVVKGFDPIMPDMRHQLSARQLWTVVAYLESQGGQVTVTAADIEGTSGGAVSRPAPPPAGPPPGPPPASSPPSATVTAPTATMDPRQLLKEHECLTCHAIDRIGPEIGPSFDGVGRRLTADRIRQEILDPARELSPGYESRVGTMPTNYGQRMSAAQLEALVQFLAGRQ